MTGYMMDSPTPPPMATWVLYSMYTDDIVIICPENIDYLPIERQYSYPMALQILRNLFQNRTRNHGRHHHK